MTSSFDGVSIYSYYNFGQKFELCNSQKKDNINLV